METLLETGNAPAFDKRAVIEVPAQIYEWKAAAQTRNEARNVQERNRGQFLKVFEDGLTVLGYERDAAGHGRFVLGEWDESWSYASKE